MKKILATIILLATTSLVLAAPYTTFQGGTGTSTARANFLLIGNPSGTAWTQIATSSLGFITSSALTPYVPYTYASSTFVPYSYGSSTYYFASNPSGYITSSSLTPYMTYAYASSTYASTSWVTSSFPTFSYASSSYYLATNPSGFITNSVNNLINYPNYSYASSTFASTSWVTATFAPLASPTFTGKITFANASGTAITATHYGDMYPTGLSNSILAVDTNGKIIATTTSAGGLSGGLTGYVPRWTSSTTLGNASLLDDGVFAGVNATSSLYEFFVQGDTVGSHNPFAVASSSGLINMSVVADGDVLIGTTTELTGNNAEELRVIATNSQLTGIGSQGNVNDFFQDTVTNINIGNSAESGFTAQNSLSTPTSTYAWLGINGVNYATTTTYGVGYKSDVTLIGAGNDMWITNASTTGKIGFLTGGVSTTTNQRMTMLSNGNIGINTLSPTDKLQVTGNITPGTTATYDFGSTTLHWLNNYSDKVYSIYASSTNASTTNLTLNGGLWDGLNSTGTIGMLLQTTGTSTKWVATSSLGITASISGGTTGKVAIWTSASALSSGHLLSNGTVSGINATSSAITFQLTGNAGASDILNVASSTGTSTSYLRVSSAGTLTIATTTANGDITMNARIIKRTVGYASAASTTINIGNTDIATTTVFATTTFVNPTGTTTAWDGQAFELRAMATTTFGLYWGTQFSTSTGSMGQALPTTIASGTTEFIFEWDKFRSKLYLQSYNGPFN